MTRTAIYPGSFDPVTNGHLDIIRRGAKITDHLLVAVAKDAGKSPMFSIDERVELLSREIDHIKSQGEVTAKIEVVSFSGLLIDFAKSSNAAMIIRGLRAVTDFEYEFQMTGMNRRMNAEIETVFLMASEKNQFIASSMVKEIAKLDGDISGFVPQLIADALTEKCK
ncbi:MAG: pantetheine-phosphate adenylyltransferase [Alphaproteobacteria bacterium]|nr:pantetheine-phosphate adenylyltransferase [Alphaproteobacteria bacterium]